MIKTANGKEIDYQTLEQKLANAVNSQTITDNQVKIDCDQQDDNLAILVTYPRQSELDFSQIETIIKQVLAETEVTRQPLITWAEVNLEQLATRDDDEQEDYTMQVYCHEDDENQEGENKQELEAQEVNYQIAELEENKSKNNYYKSKNFSVGFVSLIAGFILVGITGFVYYFTRPCVVGECELIPQVKAEVENNLQEINQDTTIDSLQEIQANISRSRQQLNRIPRWSKSYDSAQSLRAIYQAENENIADIISAVELAENANKMSQYLPLAVEEWSRVINFWQEAIDILNTNKDSEFNSFVNHKIKNYQTSITKAEEKIALEKKANNLLISAQKTAQAIERKDKNINSLTALKDLEKNWVSVINNVENIPSETTAFEEKDTLLNNYLDKLLAIRGQIKKEESAEKLLAQVQENINLAQKSEEENQWTRAVSHWEKAVKLLDNPPENSFITDKFKNLQAQTEQELSRARIELKLAVTRNNIRNDLQKICSTSDNICNYSVTNELIKVYLTNKYLENIAKISGQPNVQTQQLLEQHINQVEKNYQYISSKYRRPLEVYNPQKKLIFRYQ